MCQAVVWLSYIPIKYRNYARKGSEGCMEEKSDPERAKERGENVQFSGTEVELVHEV